MNTVSFADVLRDAVKADADEHARHMACDPDYRAAQDKWAREFSLIFNKPEYEI